MVFPVEETKPLKVKGFVLVPPPAGAKPSPDPGFLNLRDLSLDSIGSGEVAPPQVPGWLDFHRSLGSVHALGTLIRQIDRQQACYWVSTYSMPV